MEEIVGAKLQSTLGRLETNHRPDTNMGGSMSVARVVKVHHKSATADVILVNSGDIYSSEPAKEGRFAARILQRNSFYDEKSQRYWGSLEPYAEGSLVLVAFLDGMKARPVIMGAFHRPRNIENVSPIQYPLREKNPGYERREALKRLDVLPNMTYSKVDGEGNIEKTFGNKSFFVVYNESADSQNAITDRHDGFNHDDLSENDKRTGLTIDTDWAESQTRHKVLYVHRDRENKTLTKVFIDVEGMLRITRDNNDGKLSYIELGKGGEILFRRQLDSDEHGEGTKVASVTITDTGEILNEWVNGDDVSKVTISENVNVETKGDFNVLCKKFNLTEG